MQKIVHLSFSGMGGLAEVCLSLVETALRDRNPAEHVVLFFGCEALPDSYSLRLRAAGIRYHVIPKRRGLDLASLGRIFRWLQRERPGLVLTHMTKPLAATLFYRFLHPGSRLVLVEHHSNALKSSRDWFLTLLGHRGADHCVYLSEPYRSEVARRLGPLFCPARCSVIPNGVDTRRFAPRCAGDGKGTGPWVIGTQARMVEGKDYETLLRAFAILRDRASKPVRLECAGDGPLRPRFEWLACDLGIGDAVDWLGLLSRDDLLRVMGRWDGFVLATLGENMSRAIMEAQSCGLPVVASDVPGVRDAIESERTGILVPGRDPEALAAAVLRLEADSDLGFRIGSAARDHAVSKLSIESSWACYRSLLERIPVQRGGRIFNLLDYWGRGSQRSGALNRGAEGSGDAGRERLGFGAELPRS